MSVRSVLVGGALVAASLTGVTLVTGSPASAAAPDLASAVGSTVSAETTPPKIGWRWYASLSAEQQQCLAKAGLTRPAFPLTDAEKAAIRATVRESAQGCGITLPTGTRAQVLKSWWEGLTETQRTCLKDADVTRPLGPLGAAERKALREKVTAAAAACEVTLPSPSAEAKSSGGSGS